MLNCAVPTCSPDIQLKELPDKDDPAEYCLVYKDAEKQIILTKYFSGNYTLHGVPPAVFKQYGALFDPTRPFRFL